MMIIIVAFIVMMNRWKAGRLQSYFLHSLPAAADSPRRVIKKLCRGTLTC